MVILPNHLNHMVLGSMRMVFFLKGLNNPQHFLCKSIIGFTFINWESVMDLRINSNPFGFSGI